MIASSAILEEKAAALPAGRGRRLAAGYLISVLAASVLAVVFAIAARLELLGPEGGMMSVEAFAQVALLRDALFVFAVALPTVAGLGHLLLPRARPDTPAFRLDNLSILAHLGGAALLFGACATHGWATLLLVAGGGALVCLGGAVQGVGFLARLGGPRATHASLFERAMSLTAWANLVALPIVAAALVVLLVEHVTGQALWRGAGGEPRVFEHWLRACMQPVPYVAVLPCLGLVSDILEIGGARSRVIVGAMASLTLVGGAAFGARLVGDGSPGSVAVTSFFSLLLLVPMTLIVGNWLASLGGSGVPRWFAIGFMLLFAELGATALPLALADVSQSLEANAFGAAHHDLLVAALAFAVAAALHRAWPTAVGGSFAEAPALVGLAAALFGLQLVVEPQLVGGSEGMPITFHYPAQFRAFAVAASLGWLIASLGAAVIGANLLVSLKRNRAGSLSREV